MQQSNDIPVWRSGFRSLVSSVNVDPKVAQRWVQGSWASRIWQSDAARITVAAYRKFVSSYATKFHLDQVSLDHSDALKAHSVFPESDHFSRMMSDMSNVQARTTINVGHRRRPSYYEIEEDSEMLDIVAAADEQHEELQDLKFAIREVRHATMHTKQVKATFRSRWKSLEARDNSESQPDPEDNGDGFVNADRQSSTINLVDPNSVQHVPWPPGSVGELHERTRTLQAAQLPRLARETSDAEIRQNLALQHCQKQVVRCLQRMSEAQQDLFDQLGELVEYKEDQNHSEKFSVDKIIASRNAVQTNQKVAERILNFLQTGLPAEAPAPTQQLWDAGNRQIDVVEYICEVQQRLGVDLGVKDDKAEEEEGLTASVTSLDTLSDDGTSAASSPGDSSAVLQAIHDAAHLRPQARSNPL